MCETKTPAMVAEFDGDGELVGMIAQDIDLCIVDIVRLLNANGIYTIESCCGHEQRKGYIRLQDGRILEVKKQMNQ